MKGKLLIIGGHEDKENKKEILHAFAKLCEFETIGILTTASNEPKGAYSDYKKVFEGLGVRECIHFDIHIKSDAKEFIHMISSLKGLFITGGKQAELSDVIREGNFFDELQTNYREGLHIAGTSAGASMLGRRFIVESEGEYDVVDELLMTDGFNFAPDLIIDQHFSQRGRFGRLVYEVGLSKDIIGIGIDENTAILYDGEGFKIIGENMVTIMMEGI